MKKNWVMGMLIAASITQATPPAFANKEVIGGIIGGIIGGLGGNQIGGGSGKTAATIIGAIAGTLIGSSIGEGMDEADQRAMADAQRRSLRGRVGSQEQWRGRRGAQGSFTTTREGYNNYTGEYCREYRSVISYNGRREDQRGIACSRSDGSWYEVRETQVSFGSRPGQTHAGGVRPTPYNPNPTPPPPPPPSSSRGQYEGSAAIYNITRRTHGEWHRLNLARPLTLRSIEVRVLAAQLVIHEAYVITDRGERIRIRELTNTRLGYRGYGMSENLNLRDRIQAIDLRLESMGAVADIEVTAISPDGRPSLSPQRY